MRPAGRKGLGMAAPHPEGKQVEFTNEVLGDNSTEKFMSFVVTLGRGNSSQQRIKCKSNNPLSLQNDERSRLPFHNTRSMLGIYCVTEILQSVELYNSKTRTLSRLNSLSFRRMNPSMLPRPNYWQTRDSVSGCSASLFLALASPTAPVRSLTVCE